MTSKSSDDLFHLEGTIIPCARLEEIGNLALKTHIITPKTMVVGRQHRLVIKTLRKVRS